MRVVGDVAVGDKGPVGFRRAFSLPWRAAADIVLPPRCPGCGTVVDGDHRFCTPCWMALEFLGEPACPRCGEPGDDGDACERCLVQPPPFASARAAVAYSAVARTVALRLKYGGRPGAAHTMAAAMARLVADAPADAVMAAVPLHRWRLWGRGYNQALLIARALGRRTGRPVAPDLIERTRNTPVLRGLGRVARERAVADVFRVLRPARVADRVVVLVDDVFTTGATVAACARALRAAGAAEVRVVCWARVVRADAHDR